MSLLGSISIEMMADIARLRQDMSDAKGIVGEASAQMKRAADSVKSALGGIVAGLTIGALANFVKQGIDAADMANELAQKTGLATKEVAGIQLAFKQGGVASEAMGTSLAKMAKQMVEGNDAFDKLGIKTRNADGSLRSTKDVLYATAEAFGGIKDGAGKTALAMEIFGKSGADMIPVLNGGAEGLREMAEMAQKLGLEIDEGTGKAADQFNDQMELLGMGVKGVSTQMAAQLLPTLTSLSSSFLESMTQGDSLRRVAEGLSVVLKLLYSAVVGVVEIFNTFGKLIGGNIARTMAEISGLGEAVMKVFAGDFKGAAEAAQNGFKASAAIGREMQADIVGGWKSTAKTIARAWDDSGNATVLAMAAMAKGQRDVTLQTKAQEEAMKKAAAEAKKYAEQQLKLVMDVARARSDARQAEAKSIADFELAEENRRHKEVQSARDAVKAAQAEYDQQGLLRSQIAEVTLRRLADKQAAFIAGSANYEAVQQEIEAQRELIGILQRGEARDASTKAAKEAADEWKKTTDSIGQGLTDSLFRAFESGKDFFSTFWQGIKNLFKTTVLKLLVQPVQGAINGLVGSVLGGLGSGANAAGGAGGVGDMLGLAGAVGSLAGGGGILGFAGDVFGSAIGAGTSGVGAASGLAGSIGGAIAAIPVWGWIAAGLALIATSLDKSGTPHLGGTVMADASGARQISGDLMGWRNQNVAAETVTALKALSGGLVGTLNGLAGAFGKQADFGVNAGFAADNTDPSWGYLGILRGSQAVGGWSGNGDVWGRRDYATDGKKGYEQYLVDVAAATRTAIASIGLPEWAQKTFDALGGAPTLEQLAQAASQIAAVQTQLTHVADAFAPLGGVFGRVAGLSADATLQLAGFAGGMDALISKTRSYVEAYYSEAEKAGIQALAIKTALEAAGLSTDIGSKDALRALVDTRDVATEEGRRQLAALLDVAGSFAGLAEYLGKTGQTLSSLADTAPQVALLDQATAQADRLVAVNDSVMTIGEQITTAVASAQASAEAGFAAVAANTATLTRLIERFDDGDALTVRIAA